MLEGNGPKRHRAIGTNKLHYAVGKHDLDCQMLERDMHIVILAELEAEEPGNGARRTFDGCGKLIDERGWEVKLRRQPLNPYDSGQVNALATTLLGWRDEVSLRIDGDPQGVSVAMARRGSRPAIVINLKASRAEGADLDSTVLRLAEIVE